MKAQIKSKINSILDQAFPAYPRPDGLNDDWELSPDICSVCGTNYWKRSWPDAVYCEKCKKETNTTSALSYL